MLTDDLSGREPTLSTVPKPPSVLLLFASYWLPAMMSAWIRIVSGVMLAGPRLKLSHISPRTSSLGPTDGSALYVMLLVAMISLTFVVVDVWMSGTPSVYWPLRVPDSESTLPLTKIDPF